MAMQSECHQQIAPGLTGTVTNGLAWTGGGRMLQHIITLSTTVILARILSPNDFGLFGMAFLLIIFLNLWRGGGFTSAIIQHQDVNKDQISGVFWFNTIFSFLLAGIVIAVAPVISCLFREPKLQLMTTILSLGFLFNAFEMVPVTLLRKSLRFKSLMLIELGAVICGSVTGIIAGLAGFGAWALVFHYLAQRIASCILLFLVNPWTVSNIRHYKQIQSLVAFGLKLQLGSFITYFARNTDDWLIGRFAGAHSLGVYQMAYRLMLWPLAKISNVISEVMFPSLAHSKATGNRLKKAYLKTISCTAFVTFPIVLGSWVVAPDLIPVILGDKWENVVPLFLILCPVGLLQSIATTSGIVFLTLGRMDARLKLIIFNSSIVILSFIIGIRWGAIGIAFCYAIANVIIIPVHIHVTANLIQTTLPAFVRPLARTFLCAAGMAALVWCEATLLANLLPPVARVSIYILSGVAVYILLVLLFQPEGYRDIRAIAVSHIQSKFSKFRVQT
ncbi:MAG: lipopolysaccharide biosynthesis protein [Kiritimatiellia bacterium]